MNYKRKRPKEPRETRTNYRIDGLLARENASKEAALDDSVPKPKAKRKHIKDLTLKEPLKKKVCCRRCGYMIGHIEVPDLRWWTCYQAICKKFGTDWPICKGCKERRNAR